jgi:hypothetical protein
MKMALWGTKSGSEKKPMWLTEEEKERCYATPSGWVIKQPTGVEEVLVSVKGLDTRVGAPTISSVKFGSGTFSAGTTRQVKVTFNEKVTVTGNPTLVITGSLGTNPVATFASINANSTVLTFNFTVPTAPAVLSVGAQSVSLAGGTIKESKAPGTSNAELVIDLSTAQGAGTKTVTA